MNTNDLPSNYQNVALPSSLVRRLSIVIKVSDAFTLADFEVYGLTNKREQANFAILRRF